MLVARYADRVQEELGVFPAPRAGDPSGKLESGALDTEQGRGGWFLEPKALCKVSRAQGEAGAGAKGVTSHASAGWEKGAGGGGTGAHLNSTSGRDCRSTVCDGNSCERK